MKTTTLPFTKAALVYQGGLANVFSYTGHDPKSAATRMSKRLLQSDFRSCAHFARGLKAAGVQVVTLAANVAGDVALHDWSDDLENQPFSDKFLTV